VSRFKRSKRIFSGEHADVGKQKRAPENAEIKPELKNSYVA